MRLVLDASVAVKFYAPEPDSEPALAWLERDVRMVVPDIFLVEVSQALLRHVREHRLARADLGAAVQNLAGFVEVPFKSAELIGSALSIAEALHHRLHDCMYLALAEELSCPLLTADERLARKLRGSGPSVPILLLTDPAP